MLNTIAITVSILAVALNGYLLVHNYIYGNRELLPLNIVGFLGGIVSLFFSLS
jgi:hypothetical protein